MTGDAVTARSEAALSALLREPGVAELLAALAAKGEETRIVGGAVRNALIRLLYERVYGK